MVIVLLASCAASPDGTDSPDPAPTPAAPDGADLFSRVWVEREGLGPRYNADSCVACHALGGPGGAGDAAHDVLFEGSRVHHRVVLDGAASDEPIFRSTTVRRQTPSLFGSGLVDRIPDAAIVHGERGQRAFPEITGRATRAPDGRPGRFGWKGDVPDLASFVTRACANELGLETPGASQPGRADRSDVVPLDLRAPEVAELTAYIAALPRPVEVPDPAAARGRIVFAQLGCAACHTPRLGEVDGLYSDLLLHAMGQGSAASGFGYGRSAVPETALVADTNLATPEEWRTPPLWGIADSAPYLHDGRAATLEDAVRGHGGEATRTRVRWEKLDDEDRAALSTFLASLRAPGAYGENSNG